MFKIPIISAAAALFIITASTLPAAPFDLKAVLSDSPLSVNSVAVDEDGRILGFQSLRYAAAGNEFVVAEGWGIIGTHISPMAARRGIGAALFAATLSAARNFGLHNIDADIPADNAAGLAYYEAMGFRTYRLGKGTIGKVYRID